MKRCALNPRYLELNGKPVVVVGSGEHYGAVINPDFDFVTYLDTLAHDDLNQCRVFSGTYFEPPGAFGITTNNLGVAPERVLTPWARIGDKWDLTQWNPAYWERLEAFTQAAQARGILVEYVLFCFWYGQDYYEISPLHPKNNVQQAGPTNRADVYRADNNPLLPYMDALTRRAVDVLGRYTNVYFEISNEPYSRHDHTLDEPWHRHIAIVIADAGQSLPQPPLIAMNFANRARRLDRADVPPEVGIANFHYAVPDAAKENYHLGLVLSDDETGFGGQSATPYRQEAWQFLLAGGSVFSHLDYSFTVAHPDGTHSVAGSTTPGYGGADLRAQLGFLRRFLETAQVWHLHPMSEIIVWNQKPSVPVQVMGNPDLGRYAGWFLTSGDTFRLRLPAGTYQLRRADPVRGDFTTTETLAHGGGYLSFGAGEISGNEAAFILERTA